MRSTATIFLLLITSFSGFAQLNVDFKFYDSCQEKLIDVDYELMEVTKGQVYQANSAQPLVVPDTGVYMISLSIHRSEYIAHFVENVELWKERTYSDTLYIPSVLLSTDGSLHPRFSGFTYCGSIADGDVNDTYPNGKKRIVGKFKNAWPVGSLKYFDKNGRLVKKETYRNKSLAIVKYFDSKGR